MDLTTLKLILLGIMVVATFVCGIVPLRLLKLLRKIAATATGQQRHLSLLICLLTCFSGGVFLATCFLHLLPELQEHLRAMERDYGLHITYPLAELLSCCGFFLLFFLEEVFLLVVPEVKHSHGSENMIRVEGPPVREHEHYHTEGKDDDEVDVEVERTTTHAHTLCTEHPNVQLCEVRKSSITLTEDSTQEETSQNTTLLYVAANGANSGNQPASGQCNTSIQCRRSRHGTVNLAEPEACETNCETVKEDPPILMKSMPHAHSHGVRSITFVLALSFHSVIEGLALGVQKDTAELTTLFISLMVHKVIVAFSVGLQLGRTHAHALLWVYASVLLLALMSPLGALVGMFVQNAQIDNQVKDYIILVMQGLAVGTFIYVTFFEVLLHERDNEHPNLLKLAFIFVGFALIGLLRMIDSHSHETDTESGLGHGH